MKTHPSSAQKKHISTRNHPSMREKAIRLQECTCLSSSENRMLFSNCRCVSCTRRMPSMLNMYDDFLAKSFQTIQTIVPLFRTEGGLSDRNIHQVNCEKDFRCISLQTSRKKKSSLSMRQHYFQNCKMVAVVWTSVWSPKLSFLIRRYQRSTQQPRISS